MKNFKGGFSLVELMVVVAIIAVLAAIAVPRFQMFQAKSRQAEAKQNLSFIFTLEQAYQAENDKYVAMEKICPQDAEAGSKVKGTASMSAPNELGFVTNCTEARYSYEVPSPPAPSEFQAVATSGAGRANKIVPGCEVADTWTIDQNKTLSSPTGKDAVKNCNK